jgi:predicted phage-related endonuclease
MHPNVARLMTVKQYEQRSEPWYEVRKSLLTASDCASALDIPHYPSCKQSSRLELLKKKKYPEHFPFFTNAAMQFGIDYEDEARIKFEEATGEKVHEFGLILHPTIQWLGGKLYLL